MNISPKQIIRKIFSCYGYEIIPKQRIPSDFTQEDIALIQRVQPYTMTSPERIYSLVRAVEYIVVNHIKGAIVECGVWRGGSMMAVANTLLSLNVTERPLYLFDTFEGMVQPSMIDGQFAIEKFEETKISEDSSDWCYAPFNEVKTRLFNTGYDQSKLHFVKGKVEETLPTQAPQEIALLRLDTDWYESTRHELIHLYPLLSVGGVIIIDDYGRWQGAKKAVDEYIKQNNITLLLNRLDSTGRIGIKISD